MARTSFHTCSTAFSHCTWRSKFWPFKYSTTGTDSSLNVARRLRTASALSSALPLVFPRSMILASITASEQSKKRANCTSTLPPRTFFQPSMLSKLRGKPSTRNLPWAQPSFSIACCRSFTTISTGTSFPSLM